MIRNAFKLAALAPVLFLLVLSPAVPSPVLAQDVTSNEGGDLTIGGPGSAPGQFLVLRDICFDSGGNLYALDGVDINARTKKPEGNLRISKFSPAGKLLTTIDLHGEVFDRQIAIQRTDQTIGPARIAVAETGDIYVTFPMAGKICRFSAAGRLLQTYLLPRAWTASIWRDPASGRQFVAVLASSEVAPARKGLNRPSNDVIRLLDTAPLKTNDTDGRIATSIPLDRAVQPVQDLTCDRSGNFYVKGEPNAVYKFSPDGKLQETYGGNATSRADDGSELIHTVAVDSKRNLFSVAWGNPGQVTRFDADGKNVAQRPGQFKWADAWSAGSGYVKLAVDPSDRLWVAVPRLNDSESPNFKTSRATPTIVRAAVDFFDNPPGAVRKIPRYRLGFKANLTCQLPNNVSYAPEKPVPMRFEVAAAKRSFDALTVNWQVFDAVKHLVADGKFELPLQDGKPATTDFQFVPPRFGPYLVIARPTTAAGSMAAVGEHVGVTPLYPNLPTLPEKANGSGVDPLRQLWSGLPNVRIHPARDPKGLANTDAEINAAISARIPFIVQLVDNMQNLTPEYVRLIATRYKGHHFYYEICNEPNFSSNIDDYFKGHQMAYRIIKEVDPDAKVMGPATVNLNLPWLSRLYELGFKNVTDAISLHDYEGHESIVPEHWTWKFAEIRKIMSKYGDGDKPIWQTERAIEGVRGNNFQGLVQAIRCNLHESLLETLGVPPEHDFHFYLTEHGFSSVPSYVWSGNGPHPAALCLRTRFALTGAMGRRYAGKFDFGPTGNTLLLGLRYAGNDGQTFVLSNLGTTPISIPFALTGGDSITVIDPWGNAQMYRAQNGRVTLSLTQLPVFVMLKPEQTLASPKIDFGHNIAAEAKWDYSAAVEKGDFAELTNGIFETYNDGDPNGSTDGAKIWTGALPLAADGSIQPQTLTATFDQPRKIDHVIVRGVCADNIFCALLDYDLEYSDGQKWIAIKQVRNSMPRSEEVKTADAVGAMWMDNVNFYIHSFPAVQARAIRLHVFNVSRGFVPDELLRAWGNKIPPKLMLKEFEIYSPQAN